MESIRSILSIVDLKSVVMALFLSAGVLKSEALVEIIPIDFTLLMALMLCVLVGVTLICRGGRVSKTIIFVFIMFVLFAIPVAWTGSTPYAHEKVVRLFTLTLLATVAPLVLFRTQADLRQLLNAMFLVSIFLIAGGIIKLRTELDMWRLNVLATTTISLGIFAGSAVLWSLSLGMEGRRWRTGILFLLIPFLIVMLAAGARGPLVSLAISLMLFLHLYGFKSKVLFAGLGLICVLSLLIFYGVQYLNLPDTSVMRIVTFLSGDITESTRESYLNIAMPHILQTPQGVGWGGFGIINSETERFFVHNLVVEIFLEAGWLAGLFFVWMVVTAILRMIKIAIRTHQAVAVGLTLQLVFLTIESLISGEINDNRWLFSLLPLALAMKVPVNADADKASLGITSDFSMRVK